MSETKGNKERSPLHHRYIMGILAGVIVALLAINWSQVSGLPEMLNMALALSSLILAGLAIVYSFHTSGTLNNTLEKIEQSSSSIQASSSEIKKSNQELKEKINNIPEDLTELKYKVDSSIESIGGIPSLIKTLKTNNNQETPETAKDHEVNEEIVHRLLENGGSFIVFGLYMLKIAHEKKRGLIIDGSKLKNSSSLVRTAMLTMFELMLTFRLIEIELHAIDGIENIVEITELDQSIINRIEKSILRVENDDEKKAQSRKTDLERELLGNYTKNLKNADY